MKNIFKYDQETFLLIDNDVIGRNEEGEYDIPDGWTDVSPAPGLYIPKFYPDKKVWKETATQEYIDSLMPPDPGPSEIEVLQKQVADLYYLIALGGA
ncbi:hypothetical protein [Bacillus haynesii]|uniref:hypothetical protein n=1 Tax=Bacillus haynesii TaxID=1925021 RepID=UPI00227F76B7|nr:hypothetical protein [Bacillus haynesii]MCY8265611.1 hypothetical protein [Bacillus haynesii]MCY8570407.1 hypothetical protein [Bacillus haynesii]MCY9451607.1 hypothetical protein [Bacillus haynesii]MEC1507109.1 hypothetical protein [Bacillus haynesii]